MISIKKIYSLFKKSSGINTDSRVKQKNALLFALSGENFDGNEFVENAIENGCLAAICSNKRLANNENIFYVENTLNTLQKLANYHRKQLKTPIIAITGTNGKTTTKELISTILAQ